jgi:Fe-S-cluster-containing dehydrogenase component/DMSO reductase anchor subunit
MSVPATLPITELPTLEPGLSHFNLLNQLLAQQKEMTAVELFSHWHESTAPASTAYQALLPTSAPQAGQQYAFEVDLDACSGCKACVVACHTLNGLDEHETWRKVGLLNSTSSALPIVQHVTTACHHCVDPGCLNGCPVLAYEKDPLTGIVRHLDDQCFGCKYCLMMCPYEVPQYNESLGIVRKCDMCAGRLEQGEAPACVQACPNHAIKISIVDVATIRSANSSESMNGRLLSTAPLNRLTQPTTQFVSNRLSNYQLTPELVSRESVTDEIQPGHEPLVAMLVLTQASVGMWCVLATAIAFGFWSAGSILAGSVTATLIGFIGVQAALLHLGRPWLAFRSILGWRRSWLSREAIAFGLYLGAAFSATASCLFSGLSFLTPAISIAAAALGCAAVYCSAMIYVATRRELWSPMRTLLEFAATTIGLGLAISSLFADGIFSTALLVCGSVICGLAFVPKLMDWRAASQVDMAWSNFSGRSGRMLRSDLRKLFFIVFTCLASAGCLAVMVPLASVTSVKFVMMLAAVVALVVSQLLTRWLYFASVVFARMPGATT